MNILLISLFVSCLLVCSCQKNFKTLEKNSEVKLLVGEIPFSWLQAVNYRQNSNNSNDIVHGGEYAHKIYKMDAEKYKALATQWVGIKSLDQIVGKKFNHYRYVVSAELYRTAEEALKREEEFENRVKEHIKNGDVDMDRKTFNPVLHFSHDKIFYVVTTDMSESWRDSEVSRLRLTMLRALNEK